MKKIISTLVVFSLLAASCMSFAACDGSRHDGVKPDDDKSNNVNHEGVAELSFYAVNDLHGKFMDSGKQPGVDELTTYVKELYRDDAREEVLLSSGDMWQGTVESSSNRGQLMTEWMNDVGFVSMTLGNHEFDWGAAVLDPNAEKADFPFLAINITYNGQTPSYCKGSTTVVKDGVKIGIIGAIGDCLSSISGEFRSGLSFATGNKLTSLVKNEATRLRNEENCSFIVYSIHDGGSGFSSSSVTNVKNADMGWYDTSLSDGYVDLVFEAHTHQQYILKDEYGVYHLQGGGENTAICRADVTFNRATNEYTVKPQLVPNSTYGSVALKDDPIVQDLYKDYFSDSDPYDEVIGKNSSQWSSTDLCNTVAKLYYDKGEAMWGDQYDIVLGGGYLKMRSPYNLSAGKVTYANIFSLLPFDNAIVLGSIKGSYLKSNFFSTKKNYYRYCPGGDIAATIENDKTYYIIIDTYTAYYPSNHITEVARLSENIYARDLVADYIKEGNRE